MSKYKLRTRLSNGYRVTTWHEGPLDTQSRRDDAHAKVQKTYDNTQSHLDNGRVRREWYRIAETTRKFPIH